MQFEPIWEGPGSAATSGTPTAVDDRVRDNLRATLSTQQDPREGAPADKNSRKAGV